MTAFTMAIVYCEACGSTGSELGVAATASEARRILAPRGWRVNVAHRPGADRRLDFCPLHVGGAPRVDADTAVLVGQHLEGMEPWATTR